MKNKIYTKTAFLFSLLFLFAMGSAVFGQSKVGTTAAAFLGISVSPRGTAMGGAFAAVGDEAASLYYNPGSITASNRSQFAIARTEWFLDTSLNWVGFILNLDGANAVGISFTQLDYGEERVTTIDNPDGTGENWTASDMALSLSYCRSLTDRFSVGGSVKYINQKIWHESSTAYALDIGLLFVTGFRGMRLGMSISNFGTDMKMEGRDLVERIDLDPDALGNNDKIVGSLKTDAWPLPLFFRVGVAMDLMQSDFANLRVAVDALRPSDNDEILNVGAEFSFYHMLFLRGGYKSLFREESEEGPTAGVGIHLNQGGIAYKFDYGYADFGMLEDVHMFGIGVQF